MEVKTDEGKIDTPENVGNLQLISYYDSWDRNTPQ